MGLDTPVSGVTQLDFGGPQRQHRDLLLRLRRDDRPARPGHFDRLLDASDRSGRSRHKTFAQPFYPGFSSADWWPNDGLVSVYSQMYPRIAGHHPTGGGIDDTAGFDPGAWYYQVLDGFDHMDIVCVPQLNQIGQQKRFYLALYERLAGLSLA